ncbi:acyltransferase [Halomonas sp. KAO]|uniref:acyltransferase n=1 Tax=Halomonas sp. KAO TaxID=2783858 RepID=UPI00189D69CE|nr:acyltransferase [Halomonas sp. KAO]MBF7051954.1 acyltransferase [Halomonas sp. KAO]
MSTLRGIVSLLLLILTTLLWGLPLLLMTLVKLVTPGHRLRLAVLKLLNAIALNWIGLNLWWMRHWLKPNLEIEIPEGLSRRQGWLVLSNHRSWTDIFVLFFALHRRIPMPRFFLKRALIWVPIVGLAWWALEYPFMRRMTAEQRARHPHLARRDQEATERMCRRAHEMPIAIFNFVEGTRFTAAKQAAQASPYRHLLRPRAGGVAQVLNLLGDQLAGITDVTLHYDNPNPSFWGYLCGREGRIVMQTRVLPVEDWMHGGNYQDNASDKERFHSWINTLWQQKDERLSRF